MKTITHCLISLLLLTACESRVMPYEKYKEIILPGQEREEAIKGLQEAAWYHQACPRGTPTAKDFFVADLFFFGSHKYDKAEILIVVSYPKENKLIVDHLGTFEPNAWQTGYADCIQRDQFEE